jgi:hypothetical protein
MADMAKLTNLRELTLSPFTRIGNEGLAKVTVLKSMETLRVWGTKITISGLSCLNDMPNLIELSLGGIIQDNSGLDISGLTKLERLTLGLEGKHVGKTIVRDSVRDEDLACLANLRSLKWLQGIWGVGDEGVRHLAGLTNMERLNIGGPRLTDGGLKYLAEMKKLYDLTVNEGNITDSGLRHLEGLKALHRLNITTRSRISTSAKRLLRQKLPNLGYFQVRPKKDSLRPPKQKSGGRR